MEDSVLNSEYLFARDVLSVEHYQVRYVKGNQPMFDPSISPHPVLSSVPATAPALLSVPQHLTDGDPNSVRNCSKYVFPQEPVIQLMNNKNNRSCRIIELHIPKHVSSWHTVKKQLKSLN